MDLEKINSIKTIQKVLIEELNKREIISRENDVKYLVAKYIGTIDKKEKIGNLELYLEKQLFQITDNCGNEHIITSDLDKYGINLDGTFIPNSVNLYDEELSTNINGVLTSDYLKKFEKDYTLAARIDDEISKFVIQKLNLLNESIQDNQEKQINQNKSFEINYIGSDKILGNKNDITINQDIDPNQIVDSRNTLGSKLGLPTSIENIAIIDNIDLGQGENISTKSIVVGIDNSGNVIDLSNYIIQDLSHSYNGAENSYQINNDGTQFNNTIHTYLKSANGQTIGIGYGEYGNSNVYIGKKTKDNNDVLVQVENTNTEKMEKEQRDILKDQKGDRIADDIENEVNIHLDHGDRPISLQNSDRNLLTKDNKNCRQDEEVKNNIEEFTNNFHEICDKSIKLDVIITNTYNSLNLNIPFNKFSEICHNNIDEYMKNSDKPVHECINDIGNIQKEKEELSQKEEIDQGDERTLESDALNRLNKYGH